MIKTKAIYDPVQEGDGQRILVSRYWPRGISRERLQIEEWMREVAPSPDLLDDWKEGELAWREYCERYREEMSSKQEKLGELAGRAREGTITLLCHEPEHNPHCHRHILKRLVEEKQEER